MRRSYLVACIAVVLVTLAATAFSVRASDAPMAVTFGVRDTELLQGTLDNSAFEIAMDKQAIAKSKDAKVLALANESLAEHEQTARSVKALAESRRTQLRHELKAAETQRLAKLSAYDGADFDQLYLMAMNNLHSYDLQRLETLGSNEQEISSLMKQAANDAREHLAATRAALNK
jgi:predicted outer membrane protein